MTRQEQIVICALALIVATGLAVRTWKTAHTGTTESEGIASTQTAYP